MGTILGIDPGTATMGFALVHEGDGDRLELVRCGVITTPAGQPLAERLLTIHRAVTELIREGNPEALAIEELFFGRNVTTAVSVGHARGVAMVAAAAAGLPVFEYKPAEIKQALVGYGKASKSQIQEMVRLMLGLESVPRPDDAADAVAIAICHLHSRRIRSLMYDQ